MSPSTRVLLVAEYFVFSGEKRLPPAGYGDPKPGDIIDFAHVPLVEVALDRVEVSHSISFEDPITNA